MTVSVGGGRPSVDTLTTVITGVHFLLYADDPVAARAFFRDVLGWPFVDAHEGWLIFRAGPSELGVHPTASNGAPATTVHHEVSFTCDDVEATVAELAARGATFHGGIEDRAFGRTAMLEVPGAGAVMVYQPRHPLAHGL